MRRRSTRTSGSTTTLARPFVAALTDRSRARAARSLADGHGFAGATAHVHPAGRAVRALAVRHGRQRRGLERAALDPERAARRERAADSLVDEGGRHALDRDQARAERSVDA